MSGNVVALPGSNVPGEPDAKVVELMRALYEKAQKGILRSVAVAYVRDDEAISLAWEGPDGTLHPLLAAVHLLDMDLVASVMKDMGR